VRKTPLTMLAVLGLAVTACSDGVETATADDVRALRTEVSTLEDRLDRTEKELSSLKRRTPSNRDRVRSAPPQPAPETVATAEPAGADDDAPTVTSDQFRDFLSTDNGQKVFAAAIRDYQQQQGEARRGRVIAALVEPFAKKQYLSPDQTERMTSVLEKATQQISDAWASMRDVPPEKRGEQVAANIQRTQEIRAGAAQEIGGFLSSQQFEAYEEDASQFFGMPRPPRRDNENPPQR
jgi:hypothetical protein